MKKLLITALAAVSILGCPSSSDNAICMTCGEIGPDGEVYVYCQINISVYAGSCEYVRASECNNNYWGRNYGKDNTCGGSVSGGGNSQQTGIIEGPDVYWGGETYKTVKIGDQTWFKRNLNYDVPNNDTDVCYNNSPSNCATYGRLYNWATAMDIPSSYNSSFYNPSAKHRGICPPDYHIPNKDDWDELMNLVGGYSTAGKYLKTSDWGGNNKFGFSALPSGYGSSEGRFERFGDVGRWWSSYESNSYSVHCVDMDGSDGAYCSSYGGKSNMYSVRCLQD